MDLNWIKLIDIGPIIEGELGHVVVEGQSILLTRWEGQVYALEDTCPHRGVPLHKGELDDGCVMCPAHGWAFALINGEGRTVLGTSVRSYPVKEDERGLFLGFS